MRDAGPGHQAVGEVEGEARLVEAAHPRSP